MNSTFSVFKSARSILQEASIELQDFDALATRRPSESLAWRFTAKPAALLHWCRGTERALLDRCGEDAVVFAGFERFSRARFVQRRYEKIARSSRELTILGLPDHDLSVPSRHLHPVHEGPLLLEWFLIVLAENYAGMLTARDLDGLDTTLPPSQRRFEGIITHKREAIIRTASAMCKALKIRSALEN